MIDKSMIRRLLESLALLIGYVLACIICILITT